MSTVTLYVVILPLVMSTSNAAGAPPLRGQGDSQAFFQSLSKIIFPDIFGVKTICATSLANSSVLPLNKSIPPSTNHYSYFNIQSLLHNLGKHILNTLTKVCAGSSSGGW
jgi:hypothetical protein